MKSIPRYAAALAALALALAAAGCGRRTPEHYGDPFTAAPAVTIAQLLDAPGQYRRQPVRVTGGIERQCPSEGCWMYLRDAQGRSIRVELGDYIEKLPQRIGAVAEVEGEWIPQGEGQLFVGTRIEFQRRAAP